MKFEKALVTGGAGFIGSHLVEELVKNNVKVLVVDNLLTGKKSNIDKLENVEAIYDDLGSDESLKIIETFNPDICFHLAAQSSVVISVEDPLLDFEHNLLQPIKLIQKLISTDCKKFVFSSSGGTIFGEPNIIPTSEEDFAGEPVSPYGVAKKKLNDFIKLMLENEKMSYSILNLSNVYGPRQDPHGEAGVMSIFTGKMLNNEKPIIYGDGNQTRDFIHVADVAHANMMVAESDVVGVFNVGSGVEYSVNQIAMLTNNPHGTTTIPSREGEARRSLSDNTKLKDIGWQPRIGLEAWIARQ